MIWYIEEWADNDILAYSLLDEIQLPRLLKLRIQGFSKKKNSLRVFYSHAQAPLRTYP
jgi:hypothetical protein